MHIAEHGTNPSLNSATETSGMAKTESEDAVQHCLGLLGAASSRRGCTCCATFSRRFGRSWILDLDTMVKSPHRHRESAEVGHNQGKRRGPSRVRVRIRRPTSVWCSRSRHTAASGLTRVARRRSLKWIERPNLIHSGLKWVKQAADAAMRAKKFAALAMPAIDSEGTGPLGAGLTKQGGGTAAYEVKLVAPGRLLTARIERDHPHQRDHCRPAWQSCQYGLGRSTRRSLHRQAPRICGAVEPTATAVLNSSGGETCATAKCTLLHQL